MKELIEKKDWAYYLYKDDQTITLEIPIESPPPGFDIIHELSQEEYAKYLQAGITTLQSRIEDMKENFEKYKRNSWR